MRCDSVDGFTSQGCMGTGRAQVWRGLRQCDGRRSAAQDEDGEARSSNARGVDKEERHGKRRGFL